LKKQQGGGTKEGERIKRAAGESVEPPRQRRGEATRIVRVLSEKRPRRSTIFDGRKARQQQREREGEERMPSNIAAPERRQLGKKKTDAVTPYAKTREGRRDPL